VDFSVNLRYCFDHVDAKLNAALGMIGPRVGHPAHAVITISQELDSQAEVFGSQLVKPNGNNSIILLFYNRYRDNGEIVAYLQVVFRVLLNL
jgi:hypothetical protein